MYNRRQFLKTTGSLPALSALSLGAQRDVSLASDPSDPVASAAPARWALKELEGALTSRGIRVNSVESPGQAKGDFCVVAAGRESASSRGYLTSSSVRIAAAPEALGFAPIKQGSLPALLACGHDERGLVYALLELADQVRNSPDPAAALQAVKPLAEQPANRVRSLTRLFCTDVEDKPWYNDREMWPRYLTMMAEHRFNRFNLALGIGYDFVRQVTDAYFLFSYPFLLDVPGYKVRSPQLPDAERDSNLAMLKFISEQTVQRGMQFQLGLWMHAYEWINSANPNYTIEGLNKQNHGPYCRDAVRTLLQACPAISGVTFRIHGESGVDEGSYDFWKTVFDGVATCGRKVEIDMHAKGMDENMQQVALNTGLPITISPKYWAEHLGLPYHQADIRALEVPRTDRQASGLMRLSAGERSFLRYGYGDLLKEDRRWKVVHRIWPGTQRLLLWGDPVTAASHSRNFSFCGSEGVEIMEPLSFKGRRGSGLAGDRAGYADPALKPRWDWEKYVYSHRIWGRILYNPDCDPEVWRRYLRTQFGAGAVATETALSNASRILPAITTVHGASAGNNTYWPEVYVNHSMVDGEHSRPYTDTPAPRVFGNVSPLDPQLFSRINDFADQLLTGRHDGKYSPIEAAVWLEDWAAAASAGLAQAEKQAARRGRPEYRRLTIDVALQADIGRFFAAKFRSGVLYRIFEQSGDRAALEESLKLYRAARASFAQAANRAKGVYVADLTVGENPQLRGHWLDRLPAIDADIALVAAKLDQAKAGTPAPDVHRAIQGALARPRRTTPACKHTAPANFRPGQPLELSLSSEKAVPGVRLHYRHVNHAERFQLADMQPQGNTFRATVPGAYLASAYPLEYYFEVRQAPDAAALFPGFKPEETGLPYFVVRRQE